MAYCGSCGKKETRTRKINNHVCTECTDKANDNLNTTNNTDDAASADGTFSDEFLQKSLIEIDVRTYFCDKCCKQ